MNTKRYRTVKAANMVAVVFALATAAIMMQSAPVEHWAARHAHPKPSLQPRSIPSQKSPDVRETITHRPHVRLRQA